MPRFRLTIVWIVLICGLTALYATRGLWHGQPAMIQTLMSPEPEPSVAAARPARASSHKLITLPAFDPGAVYARHAFDVLVATHPQTQNSTWLLVGSDSRKGEPARSDALLLARISHQDGKVFLLSIPRDTRVWVSGYGYTKINHTLAYGGLSLLKDTMQKTLQIKIDHVAVIDFAGFRELIDAIGGVPICVDHVLHYDDNSDGTHIHLTSGWHRLSGKEALDYVRFRHDAMADTGRMKRQQQLLSAIGKMSVPIDRWWGVSAALFHLTSHVKLDTGVFDALSQVGRLALAPHKVTVQARTLAGVNRVDHHDRLWYFYVNERDIHVLHRQLAQFDREK